MKHFANFNLCLYTDVLFGKGVESDAGKMIVKHGGSRVMVIYGSGSVKKSGLLDRILAAIRAEGLYCVEFGGVKANPLRSLVDKCIEAATREKIDFFLAVGGGSVIDTAKAAALAIANVATEYWKFFCGTQPEKMAPLGTVHTISAAGSEMSRSTVIVDDVEKKRKVGVNWDCCRPVFALMNPELTYSVPAYQTAAGAADIIAHSVSRYFTKDMPSSSLGDEFAEGIVRTVIRFGPVAVASPEDYEARAELMMAAAFSHNDLTGIGRSGPRGGEHPLEHQISGLFDTAHGAGLAVIIPAWLQYAANNGTPAHVARIARFFTNVFGMNSALFDDKTAANAGLAAFRAWIRSIGMPLSLRELGVPADGLEKLINKTIEANNGKIPGFIDLDESAIRAIYTSAF